MTIGPNTKKPAIVGLGEVLWDVFPDGPRFGGAPANFACNAAGLAGSMADVSMVSAVGRDDLGQRAIEEIIAHGVDADFVAKHEKQTGQVLVQIDAAGHASYEFAPNTAWDNLAWSDKLEELARRADAVCFGTLGQRSEASRQAIRKFVQATPSDCLRIFDINLRSPFWNNSVILESLPLANVLKCNDEELPVLASLLGLTGTDEAMLRQLMQRYSFKLVALTRGAEGSLLVSVSDETSELPVIETQLADTVGAGDSFTAALTLGLLHDLPLPVTHRWANRVSAYVCSQSGATPSLPAELHLAKQAN